MHVFQRRKRTKGQTVFVFFFCAVSPQIEEKDKRERAYDEAFSAYTVRHWEIQYAMKQLTEEEQEFVHIRYILGVYDFDTIGRAMYRSRRAVFGIRESVLEKISKL